jgi:hypothetical protein
MAGTESASNPAWHGELPAGFDGCDGARRVALEEGVIFDLWEVAQREIWRAWMQPKAPR